jgi:endoglycosylceramidase
MRLITLLLTAVLGTGLLAFPPQAATAAGTPADAPRARPHGRWLLDPQGRVLVLHGLNMVYKRAPYAPDAEGFGRDDARFLARNGFTTVRLGLVWKAVEPSPGEYDDAYLARIRRTAQLLAREGIWTLLDFHQDLFNERFQGEGAPDWAVQDEGLPAEPQAGFPANYFGMPALNRAFDHFWADDPGPGGVGLQDRYAAA